MPGWSLDPSFVRQAFDSSAEAAAQVVGSIEPGQWDEPGLGGWTVRDLVGHTSRSLSTVVAYLDEPVPAGAEVLDHALDYFRILASTAADPAAVLERGRQAGRALGDDPAGALAELAEHARAQVADAPDDALVTTPGGVMRLIDYLPSRVFELTVHRLDVERATGIAGPAPGPGVELSLVVVAGLATRGTSADVALLSLTGRQPLPDGFSLV
jgi:uncharacterized protein (TIGR03083 family)